MATGILAGLNNNQRDAVTAPDKVLQVLAPPGSGKTKTLTARVAYLISEQHLKPWNIVVCTFTNKAANEMKDRIRGFIGDEVARQLKLGTFHSIALRYLRSYGQYIGLEKDFGIADSNDSKAIVNRIIKQHDLTIDGGVARGRISSLKAQGIGSEHHRRTASKQKEHEQEFALVYSEYEATLQASKLLDYDDILLRCCDLLRAQPGCVSNVEALLIDEFQDTNHIQYELMGLFSGHRNHITIVGDPDQSIYGWRSAETKNLIKMKKQWSETRTINLKENYRSSGAILHAAQHIIEQDQSRPPKKLQATHSPGLRPVLRKVPSPAAEARWLVSEVKRIRALTGGLLEYSDFAVLLRSAYLSRPIEAALGEEGVPYRMIGGTKFYDRAEVKLVLDYLRVLEQPDNSEAVSRIINTPARRIGDKTVESLQVEARRKCVSLWNHVLSIAQGECGSATKLTEPSRKGLEAFANIILSVRKRMVNAGGERLALPDLLNILLKKLSFQEYLKKKYPEDHETRWANVEELLAQASEASAPEALQSMIREDVLPAIDGLDQREQDPAEDALPVFLANIALTSSAEDKAEQSGEKIEQITLSTIHGAKGLEWPVVFIPGCYEGSIPSTRSEDTDEERRLLYVAMTRAQAVLYLSCPLKNSRREESILSNFLAVSGVSSFFEEHGPSLSPQLVGGLAVTLRRDSPALTAIEQAKSALGRDEDNYWPLNGEEPLEEKAKWDHGRSNGCATGPQRPASVFSSALVTMQRQESFSTASLSTRPGFVSATTQYNEFLEEAQLRKVDRRSEQGRSDAQTKPTKGRKRQIEGQGAITSFFGKGPRSSTQDAPTAEAETAPPSERAKQPLQEIKNPQPLAPATSVDMPKPLLSQHKPRSTPMFSRPTPASRQQPPALVQQWMDSSSPPPQPNEQETGEMLRRGAASVEPVKEAATRPAATLHTTSMQSIAPQRKTLGTRGPLKPWSARSTKSRHLH